MPETTPQKVARLGGILLTGNDWERRGAAQKLKEVGTQGFSALPALAMALPQRSGDGDIQYRATLAGAIFAVCGGPDNIVPALTRLFANADPRVRAGAAGTLGFLSAFNDVLGSPEPLRKDFGKAVPMLCEYAARDSSAEVRGQCLVSLARLTYGSQAAPWENGLKYLVCPLKSPLVAERREATEVLACCPVSLWPVFPHLRDALHDADKTTHDHILLAFYHLALTDRIRLTDTLLADIKAGGKRTQSASDDLLTLTRILWQGLYYDSNNDLPHLPDSMPEWTPRTSTTVLYSESNKRLAEAQNARLLAGIAGALTSPERLVRVTLARVLATIAEGTTFLRGHGGRYLIAERRLLRLLPALDAAAVAVRRDDPALAQSLLHWRGCLMKPQDRA